MDNLFWIGFVGAIVAGLFAVTQAKKVMTYSEIITAIWGFTDDFSVKKLQVNMANIRKKFGAHPGEISYIVNELGIGYRMKG